MGDWRVLLQRMERILTRNFKFVLLRVFLWEMTENGGLASASTANGTDFDTEF